jgi:hypothetical protein
MTDSEIKYGFWDQPKELKIEPSSITFINEYSPTEYLKLDFNQIYPPSKQTKIISEWCKLLPELKEIKFIWLKNRIAQKTFDSLCLMENLEGLWIEWSLIKNIDNVVKLKNLKHLYIGSSPKLESIDPLQKMNSLVTLELEQLNRISDFSILSLLPNLEGLGINGSLWTTQIIDSLDFLKTLTNLKYLTLVNSKLNKTTFDPILNLKELVRFRASWNHGLHEFKKLSTLRNLKIGFKDTSWDEVIASRENIR